MHLFTNKDLLEFVLLSISQCLCKAYEYKLSSHISITAFCMIRPYWKAQLRNKAHTCRMNGANRGFVLIRKEIKTAANILGSTYTV